MSSEQTAVRRASSPAGQPRISCPSGPKMGGGFSLALIAVVIGRYGRFQPEVVRPCRLLWVAVTPLLEQRTVSFTTREAAERKRYREKNSASGKFQLMVVRKPKSSLKPAY